MGFGRSSLLFKQRTGQPRPVVDVDDRAFIPFNTYKFNLLYCHKKLRSARVNPGQVVAETKSKIDAITERLKEEFKKLRTGRAHPGMLDGATVEAYGQSMPLKAVGTITAPEAQLLQITPFDPSNLQAIADAIRNDQSLGLTPTDDGRIVRINLPPMTQENRQAMVKVLGQKVEEAFVAARQARHEAFHKAEQAEKAKQIGKDELERFKKQIDELLAKQKTDIDTLAKAKEQEILTV